MKNRQILVIGNNDNGCTPELEKIAYDVGAEVAKSNSVFLLYVILRIYHQEKTLLDGLT